MIKCDSSCGKSENLAKMCFPYLAEEIAIIKPRAILAVGALPFQMLTRTTGGFSGRHGQRNMYFYNRTIEVIPIIHPSWANKYYPVDPKVYKYKESVRSIVMGLVEQKSVKLEE